MSKSCIKCPAFMGQYDIRQERLYGTNLGVPACPRKGQLLGSRGMSSEDQDELQREIAEACDSYGQPVTDQTAQYLSLSIGIGVPPAPQEDLGRPSSCKGCHYFVPSYVVQENMGVSMGLCSKFGNLIPETKASVLAKQCTAGRRLSLGGDPFETNTDPATHHDILLQNFQVSPILVKKMELSDTVGEALEPADKPNDFIEPSTYPTDLVVSDAARAQGIRAWRKLPDDKGKRHVVIPVFDYNFFTPEERAKIPKTGDDTHPEKYLDHQNIAYKVAVLWRELDETPALNGIAGTGKTEFFRYMAWLMCLPFERVSITNSSEIDELAGKTAYKEGVGTYFEYGRIPQSWAKPCVIVIDEPNVGPPDVWQFIRPLTDNSKQLVLDMNGGERISRNENCYMGMAFNPAWDSRNIGAEQISDADGSRLMHIFVEYPNEKLEKKIIRERCDLDGYEIDDQTLNAVMRIAKQLRQLSSEGTLGITWGLRPQIKVARATKWFDLPQAYRLAAADLLDPEQAELVLDIVRNNSR